MWLIGALVALGILCGAWTTVEAAHHSGYVAGIAAQRLADDAEEAQNREISQKAIDQANKKIVIAVDKALSLENQVSALTASKIASRRCLDADVARKLGAIR